MLLDLCRRLVSQTQFWDGLASFPNFQIPYLARHFSFALLESWKWYHSYSLVEAQFLLDQTHSQKNLLTHYLFLDMNWSQFPWWFQMSFLKSILKTSQSMVSQNQQDWFHLRKNCSKHLSSCWSSYWWESDSHSIVSLHYLVWTNAVVRFELWIDLQFFWWMNHKEWLVQILLIEWILHQKSLNFQKDFELEFPELRQYFCKQQV